MLKRLASETAIYGISSILGRLINYVLVPLHTGLFSTGGYGIVSIFYAWAAVLNVLYTYGMETSYFRHVTKDPARAVRIFNLALTSIIISNLFFSGLIFLNANAFGNFLGYADSERYVRWFALLIAADTLAVIPFARLRHEKRPIVFASIKMGNILLNVALNVFFLVFCTDIYKGDYLPALRPFIASFFEPELGLGYAFFANMLASLAVLPMLWPVFKKFRWAFSWEELRPMYQYAYPLIFSGLFYAVNEVLDRVLLERWLPPNFYEGLGSTDAVGIYSACYKLSIFISLAVQAYKYAAEPFFFAQSGAAQSVPLLAKSMTYFIIACCFMLLGVSFNLDWLGALFIRQEAYLVGLGVVPLLLMANIFLGAYYNLSFWYKLTDRTHYGAFISGGGAVITLITNLLLIPVLGYYGSAIATVLCYGSMALACYLLGKKHYPVPYQTKKIVGYLAFSGTLAILAVNWPAMPFWASVLSRNALLVPFTALVFWLEKKEFGR